MKYLGIDYGQKRIGFALSDPQESFAMPLSVFSHFVYMEDVAEEVEKICTRESVDEIVIGESKDFSGKENKIMNEVHNLKEELEARLKIPVHLHPEFMTSMEADRIQGKTEMRDASAAALILKSYLDVKHNNK
jgi:putative Holliday junction resolvase